MALLTAEDVLNKAFSKTKYREGFDQDEVDDFLDEVANTIAQLTAERDDLASRLASGGGAPAAPAATEEAPTSTGLLAAATEPGGVNPTGMLAMAQKLHDEYVQAGEAARDRIIDEAHVAADQIRERADDDAKARMEALAGERSAIEARIDDLRRFERDYRAGLKAYLENLLGDLDHNVAAGTGAGAVAAGIVASELPSEDEPSEPGATDEADLEAVAADEADAAAGSAQVDDEAPVADHVDGGDVAPGAFAPAANEFAPADNEFAQAAPAFEPVTEHDGTAQHAVAEEGGVDAAAPAEVATDAVQSDWPSYGEAPAAAEPEAAPMSFEEALSGEPAAVTQEAPAAPAVPAYDAGQSWESQLQPSSNAPAANPFAPVTQPAEPAAEEVQTPEVEAPSEEEEAPYTPPSSRMFTDLYGQKRPESNDS